MANVFKRICMFTSFFLIIISDPIKVKKQQVLIIAFKAGNAFVNDGAISGFGNFPIAMTRPKTTTEKIQIAAFIPFLSSNCGEFESIA